MNTSKVDYCCTKGFLIKNERYKHDIIQNINKKLEGNLYNIFEKSYTDRLLSTLKERQMSATYMSFGKYTYLFLTKIYNEEVSLIIELDSKNKKINPKIISIPLCFKDKLLFNDTLFYGEIYRNKNGEWYYLNEYLKMYKGKLINSELDSIKISNKILNNDYHYSKLNPFKIHNKIYFNLCDIEKNIENLSKNKIPIKGIKFYGLKTPICFYFNTNNYNKENFKYINYPSLKEKLDKEKLKINKEYDSELIHKEYSNKETNYIPLAMFLELRKTDNYGVYHVYANDNSNLKYVGKARIPTIEMSNNLLNSKTNNIIVKAEYNYLFKKFSVLEIKNGIISKLQEVNNEIQSTVNFSLPNYIDD